MVKVKDTQSFIAAARAIHGDRYDYSQTEYRGARNPIKIVCRNCGPVLVRCARAHVEPSMLTGCKACNKKHRRERKDAELLKRTCKGCGKPLESTNPKQTVCSLACRHNPHKAEWLTVECQVCGTEVKRTRKHFEKFGNACCSRKCQRVFRTVAGNKAKINWHARSQRAKERFKRESRRRRLRANPWRGAISSKLAAIRRPAEKTSSWEYKIRVRLNANRGRRRNRKVDQPPSGSVAKAITRIMVKRKWFERDPWFKKINNRLSSCSKRRRRKHEVKCAGDIGQVEGNWIQVCFDWMADQPRML